MVRENGTIGLVVGPAGIGKTRCAQALSETFVGSVLVSIMGGAQDNADGQDITTLMGKVAVSLEFVDEQTEHQMGWAGDSDRLAATSLLQAVTSAPQTVLTGIRAAEDLVAAHP